MAYYSTVRSKSEPSVLEKVSAGEEQSFIEAARRAQIVRCAIDTIAELGYARASLVEIAKRAKVSKSVISYYFAGKDELILQVVEHVYTAGAEFMLPRIVAHTPSRAQLRAYILANVAYMMEYPKNVQAMVEIVWGFRDERGQSRLDEHGHDPIQAAVEEMLRAGQEAGEFRAFSQDSMAFAIRAAIDMLPPLASAHPETDLARYGEELADLFDIATRSGI